MGYAFGSHPSAHNSDDSSSTNNLCRWSKKKGTLLQRPLFQDYPDELMKPGSDPAAVVLLVDIDRYFPIIYAGILPCNGQAESMSFKVFL